MGLGEMTEGWSGDGMLAHHGKDDVRRLNDEARPGVVRCHKINELSRY